MTKGGARWLGDNYKDIRWSKLLCNKLGAEEHNFAEGGGSNQRIWRNITTDNYDKTYDLAIIQLTFPSRTEWYNGEEFVSINSHIVRKSDGSYFIPKTDITTMTPEKRRRKNNGRTSTYWQMYYERIYDDVYGETIERSVYNSVKSIFKAKNTKLILLSCYKHTKLDYDIMITSNNYETVSETDGHPNKNSQELIANDIYNLLQ